MSTYNQPLLLVLLFSSKYIASNLTTGLYQILWIKLYCRQHNYSIIFFYPPTVVAHISFGTEHIYRQLVLGFRILARKFGAAWGGFAQQIILKGVVGFTAHKAIGNNNLHFKIVQYGKSEGIFVLNIYGIAKCVKYGAKICKIYMPNSIIGAKSME